VLDLEHQQCCVEHHRRPPKSNPLGRTTLLTSLRVPVKVPPSETEILSSGVTANAAVWLFGRNSNRFWWIR
jgi:hypothetical protein